MRRSATRPTVPPRPARPPGRAGRNGSRAASAGQNGRGPPALHGWCWEMRALTWPRQRPRRRATPGAPRPSMPVSLGRRVRDRSAAGPRLALIRCPGPQSQIEGHRPSPARCREACRLPRRGSAGTRAVRRESLFCLRQLASSGQKPPPAQVRAQVRSFYSAAGPKSSQVPGQPPSRQWQRRRRRPPPEPAETRRGVIRVVVSWISGEVQSGIEPPPGHKMPGL